VSTLPVEQVEKRLVCVQTPHILPSLQESGIMASSESIEEK
tara:strand:- start:366 stop:488 length:123 start_codon:yes stop_codon:yes gene_type:complete